MKKKWLLARYILIAAIIGCAMFLYVNYQVHKDEPFYLPGRDTVKYWDDGQCQLARGGDLWSLHFHKETLDNEIIAYRQIERQLFFRTWRGRAIVIDLNVDEYDIYESLEDVDSVHKDVFADPGAFTFFREEHS